MLSQRTLVRMMELFGMVNDLTEERERREHDRTGYYYRGGAGKENFWSRKLYEYARSPYWPRSTFNRCVRLARIVAT